MRSTVALILIDENTTLASALRRLCDSSKQILFICNGNGLLKAALSDGDIRRFLLSGGNLDAPVSAAANYHPTFLMSTERERAASVLAEKRLPAVPIVDEDMKLQDVVFRFDEVDIEATEIRELSKTDMPMLLEFFDQMAGDTRAMFNRNDVNRIRAIKHFSGEAGKSDGEIHFAATVRESDGSEKMVGYAFLWDLDTKMPWLGIAVREDWKGHHLGRKLLAHLDEWASPRGYGGLMLTSVPANVRAHSLYARMGFEYFGTCPNGEFLYIKRYPVSK